MELPMFLQKIILAFQTSDMLRRSGEAGVIIMTGLVASHFISRFIGIAIRKFGFAEPLKKRGVKNPDTLIENASNYIILAVAFILALNGLGLLQTVLSITVLIIVSIVVILLVLNFKDMLSDFFAGIVLHGMYRDVHKGAIIKAGDLRGEVKRFGWLSTELCTKKKECIIVPSTHLLKCKIEILNE